MARIAQAISDIVNPKPTALVPIAVGSEEIEVAALCDILARGGVRVTVANVAGSLHHIVKLAKGTDVQADKPIEFCVNDEYDVIAVPGGPGAKALGACRMLTTLLKKQKAAGKLYAAVGEATCDVLFHNALVEGPMASDPAGKLVLRDLYSDDKVVITENCVTSKGPATVIAMAVALVELLRGENVACTVANDISLKTVRTLEPVRSETDYAQYFVGTSTLNQPNKIYLVQISDDGDDVITRQVFSHPGEVLNLAPSPQDRQLLVTCSKQRGKQAKALLWKLPQRIDSQIHIEEKGRTATTKDLEQLAPFPEQKLPVSEVVWDATADTPTLASSHETLLRKWSLDGGSLETHAQLELDVSTTEGTTKKGASALVWDPHHSSQLAFALGGGVLMWDLRVKQHSVSIKSAHLSSTLSLDFNPNKPYMLASGGDDGKIKFWDLRFAQKPVLAMNAHSHWVYSVRYHPLHDQLVLSGSSDATLALWRVSSISSSPFVDLDELDLMDETAGEAAVADTLLRRIEEHDDTVYAARWATGGDAWKFASLSYDGRFAVNHVPSTEKYKILL